MTPAELIELKKQAESINLAIAAAEKQLLEGMLEEGTEQIKAAGGSITLQYRASKPREKSLEELALLEAIEQETAEMSSNNADLLYSLQRQAYMLQMQAQALTASPWANQLKAKLVKAEQDRKASKQAKPVLVFELPQPSPLEFCTEQQYNEFLAKATACKPKKMTKLCLLNWLKANSHLKGEALDKSFEKRLADHIAYWSK